MLKYNLDFEIMGVIITLIIWFYYQMNYVVKTRNDKAFLNMCLCILAAQITDIITGFTFSMEDLVSPEMNMFLNTVYFFCSLSAAVAFERYVASYIIEKRKYAGYDALRIFIIVFHTLLILMNVFSRGLFYFDPDTGEYIRGPLYAEVYAAPFIILLLSLYLIIRYRKRFDGKQWISSIVFLVVIFSGMILQGLFFPDIYLANGMISIALLMIVFSLETPDYRKLTRTLNELELARNEAYRASQIKSEFLANMSHEIRTPINAMLGFDEMILRESSEKDILSYAGNIKISGGTLLSLVNDILDFSKIEAGKMEIVPAEYDPVILFYDLIQEVRPRAQAKSLYLKCDIDNDIPSRLYGDDVRFRQIIMNLLTNAVKYTEVGGVTLTVRVRETADEDSNDSNDGNHSNDNNDKTNAFDADAAGYVAEYDADSADGAGEDFTEDTAEDSDEDDAAGKFGRVSLFVSVRDTGYGIREEDRSRMFDAFERVDRKHTRRIEGTGLGLPITVRCLKLMGSSLEMRSEYGKGSDFYFVITQGVVDSSPVGDFEKAMNAMVRPMEVYRDDFTAPEARILVVDDVEMNLKVFEGLVKKSEIRIDTVLSGEEAVEMMHRTVYDCVFMDHQMPGMDGIETLQKIREDAEAIRADVPVIALTANAIAGAREMYMEKGFCDYLTKPVDIKALSDMLKRWIPEEKIRRMDEAAGTGVEDGADAMEITGVGDSFMDMTGVAGGDGAMELPSGAEEDYTEEIMEFPPYENEDDNDTVLEFAPGGKTGTEGIYADAVSARKASEQAALKRLEAAGVNVKEGVDYAMSSPQFYLEILGDYARNFMKKAEELGKAFDQKDWKNYRVFIHAVKSTSRTVGIDDISLMAEDLEKAAARGNAEFIEANHEVFMRRYGDRTAQIREAVGM